MPCTNRTKYSCLANNLLVILTLVGVVAGITIGVLVRQTDPSQDLVIWIALPGDVFMRSLKMVVLPLIVTSVITGTASLDPKSNGRVSMVSLVYIVLTNSLACVIPMLIAIAAKPGKPGDLTDNVSDKGMPPMETIDVFADLIRNLFPSNIISACFEQSQTQYENVSISNNNASGGDSSLDSNSNSTEKFSQVKVLGTVPSTNVLGLVICSFIFGLATSSIGPAGRAFFAFFYSANAVIMKVLSWFIWMTPIGVASLISGAFLKADHLDSIIKSLGLFCIITTACLFLHLVAISVIIKVIWLRSNPLPFLASLDRVYTVTFATTSTAMAIPVALHALEERNNVDSRVTRFTIPLAATINRDGSSIFIAISCVFIAQMTGHSLNVAQVVIIWTLLTFISMATPSIPSSSIVVISIILSSLGVPTNLVGLLFATEWLLDRLRSLVNVTSHCYCALIVAHLCRNTLPALPPKGETTENGNDEIMIYMSDKDSMLETKPAVAEPSTTNM